LYILPLQIENNWMLTDEQINGLNYFPETWNKAVSRIHEVTELMSRKKEARRRRKKGESRTSKQKAEQAEMGGGEPISKPKISS
jgi:transposase